MDKKENLNKFRKISERLLSLARKNNGVIKIEHKSLIDELSSYLLGFPSFLKFQESLNNDSKSFLHNQFEFFSKQSNLSANNIENKTFDLTYILGLTDSKYYHQNKERKSQLSPNNESTTYLPIKVGYNKNDLLKTSQDVFIQPNMVKIISSNPDQIINKIQENNQHISPFLVIQSNSPSAYKIDLWQEIISQDLWHEIFYVEDYHYSQIFINIIEQFYINNNYQIDPNNISQLVNLEYLLSFTLNTKSTPFLKKILKKYLISIGLNESNFTSKDIIISSDIQTKHFKNIMPLKSILDFISSEYDHDNFHQNNQSISEYININKEANIYIPPQPNEQLHSLISIITHNPIRDYNNLIINSSQLRLLNTISHSKLITINNSLDDFENYSQIVFSNCNNVITNSHFFENYYTQTQGHTELSLKLFLYKNKELSDLIQTGFLWKQDKTNGGFYWEISEFNFN